MKRELHCPQMSNSTRVDTLLGMSILSVDNTSENSEVCQAVRALSAGGRVILSFSTALVRSASE